MIEIFTSKAKNSYAAWTYVDEALLSGKPRLGNQNKNTSRLQVESNNGAIFELCRELVVLGIPDQPWESFLPPHRPSLSGRSIRRAALMTVKETESCSFVKWSRFIRPGDASSCADCGDRYRLFKGVCLACATTPAAANDNRPFLAAATRP